ncbi:MAG: hypothetical protein QOH96_3743 [Blastocatellia bacterium]|nr:hypothetical protein [Blastocatellia bacterium]
MVRRTSGNLKLGVPSVTRRFSKAGERQMLKSEQPSTSVLLGEGGSQRSGEKCVAGHMGPVSLLFLYLLILAFAAFGGEPTP